MKSVAGGIAAIVAGGLALFLEMWTVVPAPTLPTLAVGVIIPEITPWAVGGCIAAGAVAQACGRGWSRTVGVFAAAAALGCALLPWCLVPATIARCDAELRTVIGDRSIARPGADGTATQPYALATAFLGDRRLDTGSIRVRHDLTVRTRDGARLGLDVYAPAARGPHATIVLIYGGAWLFGTREDSAQLGRTFAAEGRTAIAIDYRHAPRYRFPVQIDDVRDAIAAIAAHAGEWDVDPHRVAIFGRSAGAQLALLAAYAPQPVTVRAVVAYYSPTDLVLGYRIPPRPDPADVDRILRAYLGGTPDDAYAAYVAASPIDQVRPGLPPTLLIGGGRDELVRLTFAHRLRDALRAHGVRAAALDLPWSNHAFDEVRNGTGGQIARFYTERFLAATL